MRRLSLISCFTPKYRGVDEDRSTQVHLEATCNAQTETSPVVSAAQATSNQDNHTDGTTSCSPSVGCPPDDPMCCPAKSQVQLKCANFEALPFSWVVLSSDARDVLHHSFGPEPAAAQICRQALHEYESSSNSNSSSLHPDSAPGTQHCGNPGSKGASSFLAALLGPQLEAAALKRTQMGRPWKGTICSQLPVKEQFSDSSAHCSTHTSPRTSAAQEEGMQGANEVQPKMGQREDTDVPLRAPRQPRCKGSIRFQGVGPDEERSCGGVEEWARGGQESPQSLHSQNSSNATGRLEGSGIFDHLHQKFEGDHELQHASRGAAGAQSSEELPRSPFYDSAQLRPPLDCSAPFDLGTHAREKDAQAKLEMDISETRSSRPGKQHFQRGQTCPGLIGQSRKSSLQISQREVEQVLSDGTKEAPKNLRTKAFLKSLSYPEVESVADQKVCTPDHDKAEHKIAQLGWSYSELTQCAILEAEVESLDSTTDSGELSDRLPQPQSVDGSTMHGFDVAVSALDHSEGMRSPLFVMISDSTEHLKAREILTALAEVQLELLANIMPQHAIQFLATESSEAVPECVGQLARAHESATLMFMDICGFTSMSKEVEPVMVMGFLNTLFSHFDKLVDIYGVHKVETAGDCYIVGGGIMKQAVDGFGQSVEENHDPEESAHRVMAFAKAILDVAGQVKMPNTQQPVRIRIGIHTGDVVSGMIGTKLPKFSLFGDAMCTASRMESTGVPGRIHVSEVTHKLLPQEQWEPTGGVEVKGKGKMETYLWISTRTCSNKLYLDASSSHVPPSRQRSAPQPLPSHASHLPAIHLFHSSKNAHELMSHSVLKERVPGWEMNNSFDSRNTSAGQQCLKAMASISSMPSKINKATQFLSLLERRGILLPTSSSNAPARMTRRLEGSIVASQQGCMTTGAAVMRESSCPPEELGAF